MKNCRRVACAVGVLLVSACAGELQLDLSWSDDVVPKNIQLSVCGEVHHVDWQSVDGQIDISVNCDGAAVVSYRTEHGSELEFGAYVTYPLSLPLRLHITDQKIEHVSACNEVQAEPERFQEQGLCEVQGYLSSSNGGDSISYDFGSDSDTNVLIDASEGMVEGGTIMNVTHSSGLYDAYSYFLGRYRTEDSIIAFEVIQMRPIS